MMTIDELNDILDDLADMAGNLPRNGKDGGELLRSLGQMAGANARQDDIDPNDRSFMNVHADSSTAAAFINACNEAAATFEGWQDYDDQLEMLTKVKRAGINWILMYQG